MAWQDLSAEIAAEMAGYRDHGLYEQARSVEQASQFWNAWRAEYKRTVWYPTKKLDKTWRQKKQQEDNEYHKRRYHSDPEFRAKMLARSRAWQAANREKTRAAKQKWRDKKKLETLTHV